MSSLVMAWTPGASAIRIRAWHERMGVDDDRHGWSQGDRANNSPGRTVAGWASGASLGNAERNRKEASQRNELSLQGPNMDTTVKDLEHYLKLKCEKLRSLLSNQATNEAMNRHEIGVVVLEIKKAAVTEKYGKKLVASIASDLNVSRSVLYDAGRVAAAWSASEFEDLIKAKKANGTPLPFNVWVEISQQDAAERGALIEQAIAGGLSVRGVKQLKNKSPEMATTGRRKEAPQKSFVSKLGATLDRMIEEVDTWSMHNTAASARRLSSKLDQAIERAEALHRALATLRERLGKGTDSGNVPTVEAA